MVRERAGKRRGPHTARCVCRGNSATSTESQRSLPYRGSCHRQKRPELSILQTAPANSLAFIHAFARRLPSSLSPVNHCKSSVYKYKLEHSSSLSRQRYLAGGHKHSIGVVQTELRAAVPVPSATRAPSPRPPASSGWPSRRQTACWSFRCRTARSLCPQSRSTCRASAR